jgi:SAM-dependent methyltransferase
MSALPPERVRPCPACASGDTREFLRREAVPAHQNLPLADPAAARAAPRGTLALRACGACGFVFNAAFDPALLSYGPDYDNTQSCSDAFGHYLDGLARRLVEERGVRGRRVVEVGCGKGGFLRKLVEYPGADNVGVGYDPAYLGPEADLGGRLRFRRTFYGEGRAEPADVVVCRHVIEHVPRPPALLRGVRAALAGSPAARVFFETPCVEWILRRRVVWDLFYEHCSLFTRDSLARAFARAGFRVERVEHVFGGQYLWLEATVGESALAPPAGAGLVELALAFGRHEEARRGRWERRLRRRLARGPVAVWGAGAKGVTFCNLVDPDGTRVAAVVDVNPAKQGKYVAGTGHPIIAPDEAARGGYETFLVLNPNYVGEVRAHLRRLGSGADVVDLMRTEGEADEAGH